jgi:hypothetical protein
MITDSIVHDKTSMMSFIEFIRPSACLALIDEQTMAITIACDVDRVKQATVAALHTMAIPSCTMDTTSVPS